ncbi:hypothetical protein FE257_009708 [Aspergillus nanangensis]|uniref:Secreted LysM effector LysM C-terminal domain-containing protein n=1 Tax=Aspergillus nanangensis TaxID=2582783 RepID=A0AAD4CJF8_ASPNN|nr:hypothetical protein FE257_009708 [Aspergillus nanangensis]
MRVSTAIAATLALCTPTLGWSITFYEKKGCAQNGGDYVSYNGKHKGNPCMWLGGTPPKWAHCTKFTDGGNNGPFKCTDDDFKNAQSFNIFEGNFYLANNRGSANCYAGFGSSQHGCQNLDVSGFSI